MRRLLAKNAPGYVFLAPWLIGFLVLAIGPILTSFYLSFTKYDIASPPQFIGLENFEYMFVWDNRFWQGCRSGFR